jgi:hypothetical protein
MNKRIILVLALALMSLKAFGWGKVGHEATAIIAQRYLSPTAVGAIRQLIGKDDLKDATTWPDQIRSSRAWEHSKPFHFTSVRDGQSYFESLVMTPPVERREGDALRAMLKAEDVLRDPSSSPGLKANALKFLVHLIGDIHQPLHTGRPEDLGGNLIHLNWFGRRNNLHSIWDTGIITARLTPPVAADAEYYVSRLRTPGRTLLRQWATGSYLEWHEESQALRDDAYHLREMANTDAVERFRPTVDARIMQAGYRMALLLNSIFEGKAPSRESKALRLKLLEILGPDHDQEISLQAAGGFEDDAFISDHYEDCHH